MRNQIINGPNLNLLGVREPHIYGNKNWSIFFEELKQEFPEVELTYFQSNAEGAIVDVIQTALNSVDGIVINAAAYTHTSIAIAVAIAAVAIPTVEVHISNIASREDFRKISYLAPYCVGSISGFGLNSYRLAIHALLKAEY